MDQTVQWFLVLNPASGGGQGGRAWPSVEKELNAAGISFQLYRTKKSYDAIDAVKSAIENGFRKILVVGGDGTLSEAANGILKQQTVASSLITLGILPLGTGNDWGRTYNLSNSIKERIQLIKEEFTIFQDAAKISYLGNGTSGNGWFMNMAGCGFDAQVALEANLAKAQGKSGVMVYIGKLVKTLFSFEAVNCKVMMDGQEENVELFAVLCGIGRYAGNKMNLVPMADPADGLFDVTLIRKISKLKVILNLPKLFNGKLLSISEISHHRCKYVKIMPEKQMMLETDGESVGEAPAEMRILPGALKVVVKRGK